MTTSTNNFGDFGWWQFVVGAVQGITMGTSAAVRARAQKKYLKKRGQTQQQRQAAELELKHKEIASSQLIQQAKHKAGLYEDIRLKKLVITAGAVLVAITIIGLVLYYMFSVPSENGDYEYVYE
jgi:hypothetical protein